MHRICENSSVGRAQPCQGWGRGFESRFSLNESTMKYKSQRRRDFLPCENSSVGRAQPCQGWGRGFESRFSLNERIQKLYITQSPSIVDYPSGWWNW